jgi:hypothetical protein
MASKKLKKILKAVVAGGAGLLAAKALGGKKYNTAKNVLTARDTDLRGKLRRKLPDHLTHDLGSAYGQRDSSDYTYPETETWAAKGGRIGAKGGGIAKRGMGAAFKKGGTVKSMGIAKRGGGVAKR